MGKNKISVPKEKNALLLAVEKDRVKFEKIFHPIVAQIKKSRKNKSYVEAFLLSWTSVEQILLPYMIRQVCHRLDFKKTPSLDERTPVNTLICFYYFLTHDLELYEALNICNKHRRDVIHRLEDESDVTSINEKAKKACDLTLEKVIVPILERMGNHVKLPVLTLYAKGWNDYRTEAIKVINNE